MTCSEFIAMTPLYKAITLIPVYSQICVIEPMSNGLIFEILNRIWGLWLNFVNIAWEFDWAIPKKLNFILNLLWLHRRTDCRSDRLPGINPFRVETDFRRQSLSWNIMPQIVGLLLYREWSTAGRNVICTAYHTIIESVQLDYTVKYCHLWLQIE